MDDPLWILVPETFIAISNRWLADKLSSLLIFIKVAFQTEMFSQANWLPIRSPDRSSILDPCELEAWTGAHR